MFQALLAYSKVVDAINERVGTTVKWLILGSVLVSAGNATSRYALGMASNAWLELQWYFFAAVYMLGAAYTLKRNEHVRIDLVSSRLTARTRNWIDAGGMLIFVMPTTLYICLESIPNFWESVLNQEVSQNAGGLIRWPLRILVPIGFGLLFLQAGSEFIKRVAFLRGEGEDVLESGGHPDMDMDDDEISEETK
ncbi:TRAP transporter small permease subunit [Litorivicinus lipolyticus]|nr:TRAP transporter small permease subunit [Litorivicinus lipolyticus]